MTIPRDVIIDLLPAYLSGDVSDTTRAIVDEYLRSDPALAAQVRGAGALAIAPRAAGVPANLEVRALNAARWRVAALRWLFGLACFLSAVSLGIEVRHVDGQFTGGLLVLRYPALMIYPVVLAIVCWLSYFGMRRGMVRSPL